MRRFHAVPLGLLALLALSSPALGANDQVSDAPVTFIEEPESRAGHFVFNLGGGPTFPISDANGRFDMGWGFQLGVGFNLTDRIGIQGEYSYSAFDVKEDLLAGTRFVGDHNMQYGDLNVVVDALPQSRFGLYFIGGPGMYYRKVELTRIDGTAIVPYCDPWLYICYADAVPVGTVIGSRSSTDFGLNAGLGLTYSFYGPIRVYLEARYHYIFGPEFDTPEGSQNADGQYLPVNLGLRF